MSRTARRRALRERATEREAAGLPKKHVRHQSVFKTADIACVVRDHIAERRLIIENTARDRAPDPEWAFRPNEDVRHPLTIIIAH